MQLGLEAADKGIENKPVSLKYHQQETKQQSDIEQGSLEAVKEESCISICEEKPVVISESQREE